MLLSCAHALGAPSPWVQRWARLIRPGGTVLDVACGNGRHLRWLQSQGFAPSGVDRDAAALAPFRAPSPAPLQGLGRIVVADIERGPWPFEGETFDAVVVTNYLWRPLLPTIVGSVATGGVLIYETFALGNEAFGKPSNPDFLLRPGELLQACAALQIVAYEDGLLDEPLRRVQRIAARREPVEFAPLGQR